MSIIKMTPEEQSAKFEEVLSKFRGQGQKALMATLQQSQEIYGYLPLPVQRKVAEALDISVDELVKDEENEALKKLIINDLSKLAIEAKFNGLEKVKYVLTYVLVQLVTLRVHRLCLIRSRLVSVLSRATLQRIQNSLFLHAVV